MKHHSPSSAVTLSTVTALLASLLASGILTTSCIYDSPRGDEFYRTLWKSDEIPLGPFDVNSLTLEFLCNEGVCVKTTGESHTIYGTYAFDGLTAIFKNLTLYPDSNDVAITFIEAHRNGDTLFLLWRVEGMFYPYTTALHRLSTYE